jgi:hypothetical protein
MNNKNLKQCSNEYNNSSSSSKCKNNNNTYIDLTNDANYVMVSSKSTYCYKCGKKLGEDSLDTFCDVGCRREYYQEIKKDSDGIYD